MFRGLSIGRECVRAVALVSTAFGSHHPVSTDVIFSYYPHYPPPRSNLSVMLGCKKRGAQRDRGSRDAGEGDARARLQDLAALERAPSRARLACRKAQAAAVPARPASGSVL